MGTRKLSKSVMAALYSLNSKGRVDYFNLPRADKKILTGLLRGVWETIKHRSLFKNIVEV